MQKINEEPEESKVGLILHRLAHEDCQQSFIVEPSNKINSKCSKSRTKFSDFFELVNGPSKQMNIESTYLTLQAKEGSNKKVISENDLVSNHVQPMQIEGFKINF